MDAVFARIFVTTLALGWTFHFAQLDAHAASSDAHVHGLSELTVAIEGDTLEIELTSPASNLVGFEHKARNQKDIASVKKAEVKLRKNKGLFSLVGGRCKHVQTTTDTIEMIEATSKASAHHNKSDNHEHEHKHLSEGLAGEDRHGEITATYRYHCEDSSSLSSLELTVFEAFPGILKLDVMWLKQRQQGAMTLTADSRILKFR